MKGGITRVDLCAEGGAAPCFDEIARDGVVVIALNEQSFLLTHCRSQLEGLSRALYGQAGLAEVGIGVSHGPVSHSEILVEVRGSLEKRQRRGVVARPPRLIA